MSKTSDCSFICRWYTCEGSISRTIPGGISYLTGLLWSFSSTFTAPILNVVKFGSCCILSPGWLRSSRKRLHSPLINSSLANLKTTSSSKFFKNIRINRIDLKSWIPFTFFSKSVIGILNWYHTSVLLPFWYVCLFVM